MTAATPQSILVIEDDVDYQSWVCGLLPRCLPGASVVRASTLAQAQQVLDESGASLDLALVDLGLPDGSGIDLIRRMATRHPHITTVVTTIFEDDATLFQALAVGAQGYVLKDASEHELIDHLARIRDGMPPISPVIARRLLAYFRTLPFEPSRISEEPRLTTRELDVLRCIGRGLRVAEAARLLGLSENTIAGYVKALYRKLNVSSRAEVAIEAARRGLI